MKKELSKLVPVNVQCGVKPNTQRTAITVQRPFVTSVRDPKKCLPGTAHVTCNPELNLRLHTVITTRKCYLE
jgi:hypothetical protein